MPTTTNGSILVTAPGETTTTPRVLVVDDDPRIRRVMRRLLAQFGYQTRTAASAEEADSLLSLVRFDVVLLDIGLPRMNGIEFLEWTLKRHPDIPVVMLTALDDRELAVQSLAAGARTYLLKPVQPDFLRLAIENAIAGVAFSPSSSPSPEGPRPEGTGGRRLLGGEDVEARRAAQAVRGSRMKRFRRFAIATVISVLVATAAGTHLASIGPPPPSAPGSGSSGDALASEVRRQTTRILAELWRMEELETRR